MTVRSALPLLSFLAFTLCVLLLQTGCTVFLGSIKPVEEKSVNYKIVNLTTLNSNWIPMKAPSPPKEKDKEKDPQAHQPDFAFQSKKSGSIISLNSACKHFESYNKEDLDALTQELLLGISQVHLQEKNDIVLSQTPALQTLARGKLDNEEVMLKTVVLQKNNCVYDLVYIATPENFKSQEKDFSLFMNSLQLR